MDELITSDLVKDHFAAARVARLATITAGGNPHVVPCCFAFIRDTIVSAVDGKPKSTLALRRLENIAAQPQVSLVVDHYEDDWTQLWWIRANGHARTIDHGAEYEAALDALCDKYPQYVVDRPQGAVIVIEQLAWRSWRADE